MNVFPTRRPAELAEQPQERRWLVEQLWSEQAVGIDEPKCGKSFLALDLAVAVATGTPCLRRFPAASGRVLLFAVEDAAHVVRERLDGRAAGTDLNNLDIDVIDVSAVRLDLDGDRQRLTVRRVRPRLLVLDPLVRLHRRECRWRSRTVARLSPRPATQLRRRCRPRPPCPQERPCARRTGVARFFRTACLGRLQPLFAAQKAPYSVDRRASRFRKSGRDCS